MNSRGYPFLPQELAGVLFGHQTLPGIDARCHRLAPRGMYGRLDGATAENFGVHGNIGRQAGGLNRADKVLAGRVLSHEPLYTGLERV